MTATGKLILLAEDSEDDAEIFRHVYRRCAFPHRLQIVEDGAQALDYIFANPPYADRSQFPLPNLVLLDLRLPKIPGFEVLKVIRAAHDRANLPIVVLSSSNHDSDIRQAFDLGANEYRVKPSNPADLEAMLKELCPQWLA